MLKIIIYTLFISTFLNLFLKQYTIPTIIGYIATGTIIAYGFDLHSVVHNNELKEIAEFGVVFLMFTIGLEFSVKHLMKMKKEVFLYGSIQVILSVVVFSSLAYWVFDIDTKSSIIIGCALALSSTAIVLKILNENGDINKQFGKKVLGVLLFQDIAVIPILLMITIFTVKDGSVNDLLLLTLMKVIILIFGLFLSGKYLLKPFLHKVSLAKSNELFVSSILLIVIGSSYIAHLLDFSYSLGAFISGMMIADTHFKHQVEADLIPFRDLLLGIFFITVGMQIDFKIISENILLISCLLPLILFIKIIIIYSLFRFNSTSKVALKVALTIFQVGEFALVVFELSVAQGLINPIITQILVIIIIISMIMTPFVLKNLSNIVDKIIKSKNNTNDIVINKEQYKNHIVLIGYGCLGQSISKLLKKNNMKYVAIELDIQTVKKAQAQNDSVIFGNAFQKNMLESVNIKDASSVIIAIDNTKKLQHICEVINDLTHNTKTIVRVNRFDEKDALEKLNFSHIIVGTEKTALAMFEEAMYCNFEK